MKPELELVRGGWLRMLHVDGDNGVVLSSAASPPGSTLQFRCSEATPCPELAGVTLKLKVRSCRREGEGFRIDGRFVDLSRIARGALLAAAAEGSLERKPEP